MALTIGVSVVVVLALYASVMWFRIDRTEAQLAGSGTSGVTTFLLIGSDRRADPVVDRTFFGSSELVPGARADIVIVVRRDQEGNLSSLAIPRDLTLFRTGGGPERLSSMLDAGAGGIADALCHSLGIGIDHLVVVEFAGLRNLVDEVGGVNISAPAPLIDRQSGLLLKAGVTRADGRTALAYVRARHIEAWDGDKWEFDRSGNDRSKRAMTVLEQIGARIHIGWTKPLATHRLAWVASGAITVDGGAGPGDLLDLASALQALPEAPTQELPVLTRGVDVPTASVTEGTDIAVRRFLGDATPAKACSIPALLSKP